MDAFKVDDNRGCSCHTGNPPCSVCVDPGWECGECGELFHFKKEAEDCCVPPEPIED